MHEDERLAAALRDAAAVFIGRESNGRSLVTVTRIDLEKGGKTAAIYFSVLPKEQTHAVADFLSRQHREFMSFLKKYAKFHIIPRVTFLPDPDMGMPSLDSAEADVDEAGNT